MGVQDFRKYWDRCAPPGYLFLNTFANSPKLQSRCTVQMLRTNFEGRFGTCGCQGDQALPSVSHGSGCFGGARKVMSWLEPYCRKRSARGTVMDTVASYKHTVYKHNPHTSMPARSRPDLYHMAQIHSPYKHKRSISIWVPVPAHAYKKRRL